MVKIAKIYPRDIIALFTLIACFILMYLGINSIVMWIVTLVIAFYFARRFDGEGVPGKDLNERVGKVEKEINKPRIMMTNFNKVKKTTPVIKGPLATGDFKPKIT